MMLGVGDSSTANLFVKDRSVNVPERVWEHLRSTGMEKAIISATKGSRGFEKVATVDLKPSDKGNKDFGLYVMLIVVVVVVMLAVIFIYSFVFYNSTSRRHPNRPRAQPNREWRPRAQPSREW